MIEYLKRRLFWCLSLSMFVGCSGNTEPIAVRGTALYRGQPLTGGTITFSPNPEKGYDGPILQGVISEDGTFEVSPLEGMKIRPGWYRIAIAPKSGSVDFPSPENPYPGLPLFFRNPVLSGLEKEIKPSGENQFYFDLSDS